MREKSNRKQSMFSITLQRLAKNKLAIVGLIFVFIMVVLAIFAEYIIPYPYDSQDLASALQGPSAAHLFGTDELGRDIFSRVIYGGRYSLRIGILSVLLSGSVGILLGAVAGFFGGKIDNLIMRVLDVFQSIPGLLMAIAVSAMLGPGFTNCIIALSISTCPAYARLMRASILSVREMEYIEAATSINASNTRIIIQHVIPNAISPLIVQATMGVASAILAAASLSFIGLGVQPPEPEWGAMLSAGRSYIRGYGYMVIFPGITIMLTTLSLNMLGDGLRDALDPRLKD